jgi:two-component system, NtrC family, sensor kinase
MVKAILLVLVLTSTFCFAQNKLVDSLLHLVQDAKEDTTRVLAMSHLSFAYTSRNSDSAILVARQAIKLSEQIDFPQGEVRALASLGNGLETKGDLAQALEQVFHGLAIAEEHHLLLEKSVCLSITGDIFWDMNDYTRAIPYLQQALRIADSLTNQPEARAYASQSEQDLGALFMLNGQLDSAMIHLQKLCKAVSADDYRYPDIQMFYGDLLFRMGKKNEGLDYLRQSIDLFRKTGNDYSEADACRFIAECFRALKMTDSAIYYAKMGLAGAQGIGYSSPLLYTSRMLAELYESKDVGMALYYRKIYDSANDIYYGPEKVKQLQKTLAEEQERQRQKEIGRIAYLNRLKEYAFLAGLAIAIGVAFLLYRNNKQKQKANRLLAEQKLKVETTLSELRSTQSQLIQSEKMASLGELTAGIAHEIQNPLNFVNNFADVNKELLVEMKDEIDKGNINDAKAIADDIIENEQKISHHGKRADAIVKGMLQHSRSSTGVKEPTNINPLADEYLRLAYHGLRAKDNLFNAAMETDFDASIGKINIIPQNIGRVLLNLYNNAFYAVTEKKKQNLEGYEPTVSVTTKKPGDKIIITVRDNGNGIPQKIVDKIFQPFFTTKPTGQGTGLGLSLSYDIIKAHGGEIKVESKEGEGSEFIIELPVK